MMLESCLLLALNLTLVAARHSIFAPVADLQSSNPISLFRILIFSATSPPSTGHVPFSNYSWFSHMNPVPSTTGWWLVQGLLKLQPPFSSKIGDLLPETSDLDVTLVIQTLDRRDPSSPHTSMRWVASASFAFWWLSVNWRLDIWRSNILFCSLASLRASFNCLLSSRTSASA